MVDTPSSGPTRDEIREVLRDLAAGRRTPAEVADWATPWVTEAAGEVDDEVVWEALDWLAGADLETAPGKYLHGPEDFQSWLDEFEILSSS